MLSARCAFAGEGGGLGGGLGFQDLASRTYGRVQGFRIKRFGLSQLLLASSHGFGDIL